MLTDTDRCYRVLAGRDRRFDGVFYVGVTSTHIYCRPSCPARTPRRENTRFYPSAAAAQEAGFRACRRCRPEAVPGSPDWDVAAAVSGRAMRLIGDGVVDREGVPGLAGRLGYSPRQLHRLLVGELGAGPLALARARRAQTARTLVESTSMSLADIAFAAGFSSVRQFNATMQEVYGVPPRALRRGHPQRPAGTARADRAAARLPPAVRRRRAGPLPAAAQRRGCRGRRCRRRPRRLPPHPAAAARHRHHRAASRRCGRPRVRRRNTRRALHPAPVRRPRRGRRGRALPATGRPRRRPGRGARGPRARSRAGRRPASAPGPAGAGSTPTGSSSPPAPCSASR